MAKDDREGRRLATTLLGRRWEEKKVVRTAGIRLG